MNTIAGRHAKTLARIENEPEYKRKTAENRFHLVKEFLTDFEKAEVKRTGPKFSRHQAIIAFCRGKGQQPETFTRWLRRYEANGIKGLLPGYGNRKGCSPYLKDILPIAAEIIKPGQPVAELHRLLLPICEQVGIAPPSAKTLGRMIAASGLIARKEKNRAVTKVKVTLEIDTQNPLGSLLQLAEFIQNDPAFSETIRTHSTALLRKAFNSISRKSPLYLSRTLTTDEIQTLIRYRTSQHKRHCAIATALLMINKGALLSDVVSAAGCHPGTVLAWIKKFHDVGISFIEVKPRHPERTERLAQREARIIDIIHTPPSAYNINRTTWTYGTITDVYLLRYSEQISKKTVERAVKKSGCTWRRIKTVQTSQDPEYLAKVDRLLDTLQGMKKGERFFFIDEVGPYRVRKYGGRVLMPKGETITLPEHQKSRGTVQFVAALEAITNQLTWVFTPNKGATAMISLLEKIMRNYTNCLGIFITWDAITVHSSKMVTEWIAAHNEAGKRPHIVVVPLPSNAQFLNVIESVFCGMKKAVICNSDYPTAHAMQEAIARHFEERNQFYKDNPKRAGNKIWDKQRFDFDKLAGGLFKKM